MSPTTKNIEPRIAIRSGHQAAGQQRGQRLHVRVRRGAQLQPPRCLLAPGHQVVAVDAERVLGPGVGVPLGRLDHLRQPDVDRPGEPVDPVQALLGEVERDVHLVEQHLEAGVAVAGGPGDHRHVQLAVGQVRLVAAQVEVEPARRGRPARRRRTRRRRRRRARPTPTVRARKISLRRIRLSRSGSRRRTSPIACPGPAGPAGRHLLLEPADPVEHVVDPAAGDLLHHRLDASPAPGTRRRSA